jgi:hypothetical protein
MITFTDSTPAWIKTWVSWTVALLIPEWDVTVSVAHDLYPDVPDCKGEIESAPEYLRATVRYDDSLEDNEDGRRRVVHEICHAFLSRMSETAQQLISSKVVRKTAWCAFEHSEEATVVILSRILVHLREQSCSGDKA